MTVPRMETHRCRRLTPADDRGLVVGLLSLDGLLEELVDEAEHVPSAPADVRRRRRLDLA